LTASRDSRESRPIMGKTVKLDDDIELVPLSLPLDRATRKWLVGIAKGSDNEAARIIASMLHDIRVDDERAHSTLH